MSEEYQPSLFDGPPPPRPPKCKKCTNLYEFPVPGSPIQIRCSDCNYFQYFKEDLENA